MELKASKELSDCLRDVCKRVRRMPRHTCEHCWGKGTTVQEVDNGGGWDRVFADVKCSFCGGEGECGGGQPSLTLYFQSEEERDEFKAKILRMRGIKWEDEGNILETKCSEKS